MIKTVFLLAFFVQFLHFGGIAQSKRVKLKSTKDSLSFALGVESMLGITNEDSKYEAMDMKLLVKGFESNLSNSSTLDCDEAIRNLLGQQGMEFHEEFIPEGSLCFGRMSAYYFYTQMDQMGQLADLNLDLVKKGFRSRAFNKDQKTLKTLDRAELIQRFAEKIQADFDTSIEEKDKIFWDEVLSNPNVQQIGESGIYFETIEQGSGGKPSEDSDIEAHYILTNAIGDTLESSYESGSSLKMNLSQLIEGWREGFPALEKGGKYRLFIPYEKAYKGGNLQAPQGALCFYIEFIDYGEWGTIAPSREY